MKKVQNTAARIPDIMSEKLLMKKRECSDHARLWVNP
jgi:hypothetical protein